MIPEVLDKSTVMPGYTGTLRISKTSVLKIDSFQSETKLLEGADALRFYRKLRTHASSEQRVREAGYWINELEAAGVRA